MDIKTYDQIFYLSMGAILIPIAFLLIRFNRQPIEYKWLAIVLLFSFSCDFVNEVQYQLFRFPVNIIGNAYIVISPILLSCFFYHALKWRSLKAPLVIFNVCYALFSILNFFLIQKFDINTYSAIAEKLLTMLLCILYYYKVIKELPAEKIYYFGLFWIVSSMFIVNSAKLVLYTFAHYLVVFKDNLMVLWSIHNIMSIVYSLSIATGILVYYRNPHVAQKQLS
jgi:hypothetical protein